MLSAACTSHRPTCTVDFLTALQDCAKVQPYLSALYPLPARLGTVTVVVDSLCMQPPSTGHIPGEICADAT